MLDLVKRETENQDAIAVIDVDGVHSYAQLLSRAADIVGAIEGTPAVAIRGSHGLDTQAAILAALVSARRIVFIDPAADLATLGGILAALGVSAVLDTTGAVVAAPRGITALNVRELVDECAIVPADLPLISEDYAILTTGTTGEPKVILQTIANLRAHIAHYAGYVGIRDGDRILQLASAGWDAGLMDIFTCLWHRGVLCSINPRVNDVATVRSFIADHAIGVLHMTVPYFRLMHVDSSVTYPSPIRLVLGGELIGRRDLERFGRVAPTGSVAMNAYGPTECTTALYNRHCAGETLVGETWPLAYGVDGVEVAIVRDGQVIHESEQSGELLLKSRLVARRFDPATGRALDLDTTIVAGERYYATGDLAHRDEHGRIVITGRTDSVIKVNGQKVSLHEVETALRALPQVTDVCVLARPGEVDAMVIAAIVPADTSVEVQGLRRALAARLAPYKLPKQLLLLPALPLNQNNKIDRVRILALAEAGCVPHVVPDICTDPLLAEIAKALRGAAIDPALSFVENGGDSLRALSIVAALKRRGYRMSLEALVSTTPIGQLRCDLSPAGANSATNTRPRATALPNRAFLKSRGIPDLDRWCQTAVFDHVGGHDVAQIIDVVDAVLARHASSWPGTRPTVQVVEDPDLRAAVAATEERISLAGGRSCVAAVVSAKDVRHVVLSCHQFHIDRASWILLLGELADGTREGAAAVRAWPAPTPDYAGWATLYEQHRANDRASEIWAALPWDRCAELATVDAPFPPRESFCRTSIDLGSLRHSAGGSALEYANHALLAAVLTGLAHVTGNRCQKLDVLGHGRDLTIDGVDPHGIVGWFTVIHPLVLDIVNDPAAVMRDIAEYAARARSIAYTFGNEHHGQGSRRCDVSYNFLGELEIAGSSEYAVNPLSMETMHGSASHRLELTGHLWRGRMTLVIDHDPGVLDPHQIEELRDAIARAFAQVSD